MGWLTVCLEAGAEQVDAVSDALEALGALAVTTRPGAGHEVLEPAPGERPLATRNLVTGLFDGATDTAVLQAGLASAIGQHCCGTPKFAILEDEDWEHAWRQEAQPRCFGAGLWVLPVDAESPPGARAVVRLDPGLAFGTGAHPTTALCLEWLATRDLRDRRVIDYGCGSGILAIAAAMLGAAEVWVWDHDPQALLAARDNAARNGVQQRLREADVPPAADFVVANILANALYDLAPLFARLTRPGGRVALSGILPAQGTGLLNRYQDAFAMDTPLERDGWLLLGGRRR